MKNKPLIPISKEYLNEEVDARIWVKAWQDAIGLHPSMPWDEGSMIGWFANAIMAGWDAATRKVHKEYEDKQNEK